MAQEKSGPVVDRDEVGVDDIIVEDEVAAASATAAAVAVVPESEIITRKHSPEKLSPLIDRDVRLHLHLTRNSAAAPGNANAAHSNRNTRDKSVVPFLVLDLLVGHLLIGPLITACWRAAWIGFRLLLDFHFEEAPGVGTAVCVFTGILATNILCTFASPFLDAWEESTDDGRFISSLNFCLVSRFYTVTTFLSNIILWKGWWEVSKYAGSDVDTGLFTLAIGLMTVVCLRSGRSAVGFPLVFQTDRRKGYFRREMFFGCTNAIRKPSKSRWLSLLFNCLLTTTVEVATISCWYGVWVLSDRASDFARIDQERQWETAVASLVLGSVASICAFIAQFPLLWKTFAIADPSCAHTFHCLSNNALAFLGLVSSVSHLRAFWILLDLYFIPGDIPLSLAVSFSGAFALLTVLQCASSLHGGMVRDPAMGAGGFIVPGFYATSFMFGSRGDGGGYDVDHRRRRGILAEDGHTTGSPVEFAKFSVGDRDGVFANDVDAIGLAPLAKFDSVCDTMQGEDEYAEDEVDED